MKKTGCVHLVGAGCGDADLITLRGWNLLRACDVVIYDDLIAPELLEALPDQVEKRYMGKRSSCHSAPQAEICAALVDGARKGRRVVRLKGGDPFLFGRGGDGREGEQHSKRQYDAQQFLHVWVPPCPLFRFLGHPAQGGSQDCEMECTKYIIIHLKQANGNFNAPAAATPIKNPCFF